ncbi:MAG: protein kinase [Planctomycetes bacterium]|nr:protein kinase [Planctomycetota bacterium]
MTDGEPATTAFRRIRQLFEAAVELPAADRAAFLTRECRDAVDDPVRREVEQLLAADAAEGRIASLLERGPDRLVEAGGIGVGGRIDDYRILGVLGSGGMGTVYEAEQDEPRRRVALKVLALGLASEQAVRRFRWEAEVLASLQHPGIAQVFAVGVHRAGRIELPWFAMELVPQATDLLSFARRRAATVRDKVELLLQICEAVHHGHLRGVVHRDLKPQNLLVDERGRVKVIDFGIARSMAPEAEGMTDAGTVLGTLHYMSPEQLGGQPRAGAIDLRSDIYALGVVAFELLAGRRPFVLEETTPLAVARVVGEQEAPRLSTVVRGIERDLEVVVQKALQRDPNERYASVAELADDLRAFLADRPVRARAPSTLHQLKLFARRRRGLVLALASIVLVALGALGIVLAQGAEIVQRERVARRVAQFTRDFLAESSLMATKGIDYTVREALDSATAELEGETFGDPEIEAELRGLIGETYESLALPKVAEPHLARARELWLELEGPASRRASATAMVLAVTLRDLGRMAEAHDLLEATASTFDPATADDDPLWWNLQHNRAFLLRHDGRLRDAEALFRAVLAARERLLGEAAPETIVTLHTLGTLLLTLDEPAAARDVLADAVARSERSGEPAASTWQIADNLAQAWARLGRLDEAAAQHRAAMEFFDGLAGPDHLVTLGCGYHLLQVLRMQNDCKALEQLATDLLARCQRAFGADDYRTMDVLQALGVARLQAGDHEAATRHFERAFEVLGRQSGPLHPGTLGAGQNLVLAELAGRRTEAAVATSKRLVDALASDATTAAQLPAATAGATWLLRARALLQAERREEALDAAERARSRLAAELAVDHPLALQAIELVRELGSR